MKAGTTVPARHLNLAKVEKDVKDALINLLRIMDELQVLNATAINFNEITYVSQNDAPTPVEGQVMVWKDADATAGNPKAYIITKQGGATYTFRSVEVV